jgi:serine protease inhibitor
LAAILSEGLGAISYQGEIIGIVVNRPFLFVIHDKSTDAVLFFGRMVNPRQNDHY